MKTTRYTLPKIMTSAFVSSAMLLLMGSCDAALLGTSVDMSPAPGVSVSVGASSPISGWWDDGSYFPPYWSGTVAGPPAWGIGAPGWNRPILRPRPQQPSRPPQSPGIVIPEKPVVPPAGTRPYPTGPGPVTGGTGLPTLGTTTNRPGFRPVRQ
ncbi:MAG: hypothetical protein NC342_03210 [Pseudoflavonifractor sp.]|nr:hypothetical protein [Alloprevotella sp.]MCM1116523.1 hypothetical protein [Pseudoflavonifractor sp.]